MRELSWQCRFLAVLLCCLTTWGCDKWHDIGLHTSQVTDLEVLIAIGGDSVAPSPFESHHLEILHVANEPQLMASRGSRDFEGNVLHYQMPQGLWNLLVYNNDVWFVLFDDGIGRTEVKREILRPAIDSMQLSEPFLNEPDDLWRGVVEGYESSRDASNFVWDPDRQLSVKKDVVVMERLTCDYSVTVWLVHNNGRVVDSGALTLSGLADGCLLYEAKTTAGAAAFQTFSTFSPAICNDKGKEVEYAKAQGSIRCWGLPSITSGRNLCFVSLSYVNGKSRCVGIDVSNVMAKMPHGGELTIFLDINDYDTPADDEGMTFDVIVREWDEVWHNWVVGSE